MEIDGDSAAVVLHRAGRTIFVQRHNDFIAVACEVFIDTVVDDFPEQMMQPT